MEITQLAGDQVRPEIRTYRQFVGHAIGFKAQASGSGVEGSLTLAHGFVSACSQVGRVWSGHRRLAIAEK
jgi:hypothetical protein